MIYICSQCGTRIPDNSDFCYYCGCSKSKAIKVDDKGFIVNDKTHMTFVNLTTPKIKKNCQIALLISLVAGMFNIFGLGHLVLKSWSRGMMFIFMSVMLWYAFPPGYLPSDNAYIFSIQLLVYFFQSIDILRLNFVMEDKR